MTLRASWVTLRARWVTLRARWVTLRARWVTLRARWVTIRASWVTLRASWVMLRARWVTFVQVNEVSLLPAPPSTPAVPWRGSQRPLRLPPREGGAHAAMDPLEAADALHNLAMQADGKRRRAQLAVAGSLSSRMHNVDGLL